MINGPIICPVCARENQQSRVFSQGTQTTLMGFSPFWNEAGIFHSHDPNTHTTGMRCSRGHSLYAKWLAPCPNCDYGKDEYGIKELPPRETRS